MPTTLSAGSTGAKHPRILRTDDRVNPDELRRLAMRNLFYSRDTRESSTPHPSTGRYLPSVSRRSSFKTSLLSPRGTLWEHGEPVKLPSVIGPLPPLKARATAPESPLLARNGGKLSQTPSNLRPLGLPTAPAPSFALSGRGRRPSPRPPCSTTALDFRRHRGVPRSRETSGPGQCRANNPHPVGLVFQSPYNRHNKAFEIWHPNVDIIETRLPHTLKHIENVNFSCGEMKPYVPGGRGLPPDVQYSTASHYRHCYRRPQDSSQCDSDAPTSRFGSTPRHCNTPAVGVVPNVMSPPPPNKNSRSRKHK